MNNKEIVNSFLNSYRLDGKSENTIIAYEIILAKLQTALDDKPLKDVSMLDIDTFKAYMIKSKLSKSTQSQHLMCVKALVKFMSRYNIISTDFSANITVPKQKKVAEQRKYMSIDEQKSLINYLKGLPETKKTAMTHKLLITLYLTTGGRKNELLNLKVEDIDFESNTIKLHGKGNKERYVALLPNLKADLKNYISKYTTGRGLLFSYGGNKISDSTMNKAVERRLSEAGLPRYTVHDLRHACASAMFEYGATKDEVQMALGHESVTTTEKVYIHYTKERQMSGFAKNPLFA